MLNRSGIVLFVLCCDLECDLLGGLAEAVVGVTVVGAPILQLSRANPHHQAIDRYCRYCYRYCIDTNSRNYILIKWVLVDKTRYSVLI